MKLLIKQIDSDGRLALLPQLVTTPWQFEVVDSRDRDALATALRSADALVSMDWPADMPPAPGLRLLQLPGAGTDDIDFSALPPHTSVCNVYEHEIAIAEYVLAAMLQWVVPVARMDAALRRGQWAGSHLCGPRHAELHGRTLGILGYGRIGRETAKRAAAFGMRVMACSRTSGEGDGVVERILPLSAMDTVLGESDFVLLALPLVSQTRALIDADALGRMKQTGVIINVARGALIDEEALYRACHDRSIGGAIIDTWYCYPDPDAPQGEPSRFPFRDLDNIIMTPHASAWTTELLPRRNRVIAGNLDRLARGLPLLNVVHNPAIHRNASAIRE